MTSPTTDAFDFSALLSATQDVDLHTESTDEKLQLLQLLKTVMTILKQERPSLYNQTLWLLEDCAMKARTGAPGFDTYQSAQGTLLTRLEQTVGPDYWTQAMIVVSNDNNKG